MRGRETSRTRASALRMSRAKPTRMGMGTRVGLRGKSDRLGRLLEEWLAEARIRYTYAGE